MKKITTLLVFNLIYLGVFAQENTLNTITFCNKMGQGKASVISLAKDDLNKCDLKVLPSDTNLTVVSFTLTLFSKKNILQTEIKVNGNTLPNSIREQLNLETKIILIEYIRAQDKYGTLKLLEAISVNIE
ncbi:MAG: hypothetical protein IPO63_01665 [Bacteroidetes bacterium]|nr:hypothetical protein [Bacteroidota bacterium]